MDTTPLTAESLRHASREIALALDDLREAAKWHEPAACDAAWDAFWHTVEGHFALEEREIFPVLAAEGAEGRRHVHQLDGDHALLRRMMIDLGASLQMGEDVDLALDEIGAALDRHHAREDDWLHPAAERMVRQRGATGVRVGLCAGAATGGVLGAIAGPPGMVVGAALGAAIGAASARALDSAEHDRCEHDAALDDAIGVTSGHLGEASPDAPKARIGAFSAASCGAGSGGDVESVHGPIPSSEGEG